MSRQLDGERKDRKDTTDKGAGLGSHGIIELLLKRVNLQLERDVLHTHLLQLTGLLLSAAAPGLR